MEGQENRMKSGEPGDGCLQDLWRGVVRSADKTDSSVGVTDVLLGEAVVDEDNMTLRIDHHIVWLDVAAAGRGTADEKKE
jgi:hypothetical protein